MLWHNRATGEVTTGNPWGDGYFNLEKVSEFFPEWEQVMDDFRSSFPEPQPVLPFVDPDKVALAEAIVAIQEQLEILKGGKF